MSTIGYHEGFTYNGSSYRVTGYAMIIIGYSWLDESVTIRLVSCNKENATAVIGAGICGCIAPLNKIEPKGSCSLLSAEIRESIEGHSNRMANDKFDRYIDFGSDSHAKSLLKKMK